MVTAEEYALLAKRVYDAPAELRAPVPTGWEVLALHVQLMMRLRERLQEKG